MSETLRKILNAREPLFSMTIDDLERASGNSGIDIALAANISQNFHEAVAGLGLDSRDLSSSEIYAAIMNRVRDDGARIMEKLRKTSAIDFAKKSPLGKNVWVLKHAAAKNLLRKSPPQKLMKNLGYRSIDSMLRREKIDEIYTAIRFSENDEWLDEFNKGFAKITPTDFEIRGTKIIEINSEKFGILARDFMRRKHHDVIHAKEIGVVAIVPRPESLPLLTLAFTFHYLNEIRLYSTFFKLKQTENDFGKIVAKTLSADPKNAAKIAGRNVHWRILHQHLGADETAAKILPPHVQPEDLVFRSAAESLAKIDSAMTFWCGLNYTAKLYDDRILSFNLLDALIDAAENLPMEKGSNEYLRRALGDEILARYLTAKTLRLQALANLNLV